MSAGNFKDIQDYSSGQYQQAFTGKSNKSSRFKKFEENPRGSEIPCISWNYYVNEDCQIPCQLSHLPNDNNASLNMFNTCHTSLTSFTIPKWHSHYLIICHTSLPNTHFCDNSHSFPGTVKPPIIYWKLSYIPNYLIKSHVTIISLQ